MSTPHDMRAAQMLYDIASANPPEADEPECVCVNCGAERINDDYCIRCDENADSMRWNRDVRELVTLARAYLDTHPFAWTSELGRHLERFPVLDEVSK